MMSFLSYISIHLQLYSFQILLVGNNKTLYMTNSTHFSGFSYLLNINWITFMFWYFKKKIYIYIYFLTFLDAKLLLIMFLCSRSTEIFFFQFVISLIHLIFLMTLLILNKMSSILILNNFFFLAYANIKHIVS